LDPDSDVSDSCEQVLTKAVKTKDALLKAGARTDSFIHSSPEDEEETTADIAKVAVMICECAHRRTGGQHGQSTRNANDATGRRRLCFHCRHFLGAIALQRLCVRLTATHDQSRGAHFRRRLSSLDKAPSW
jgi:hypothetical protein